MRTAARRRFARTVSLTLALLMSACAGGPVGYAGPTAWPRPDAYACATEQPTTLGYTVEAADREAGQLRGSKQLPGWSRRSSRGGVTSA